MKDKITLLLIIGILATIALYQWRESTPHSKGPDTLIIRDTTWLKHDSLIVKKVKITKEIAVPYEVLVKEYQADTSYPKLKKQYEDLAKDYAAKRVYVDSVNVGKFGHIQITDTVSKNKLSKRTTKDNFKIPVVKETVTITKYAEPERQLYLGGGVNANSSSGIRSVEGGLLYKTKKDQIYGVKATTTIDGVTTFGVSTYFKIK
jgi:hypothetical protein